MTEVKIQLLDQEYRCLEQAAIRVGKTVEVFIHDWVSQLPANDEPFDIAQDPVFLMEGYDSDAPEDLSRTVVRMVACSSPP